MAVVACFKVLVFDPKTTVPPITARWRPSLSRGEESKRRLLTKHARRGKLPLPPKGSGPYTGGRTDVSMELA
jgi:hypothetical protein